MSRSFSRLTKLPAFNYKGPNALKVGEVKGVWARNLLANRIYRCPVVFLEPYIANSKDAYERIQLGNYKGENESQGRTEAKPGRRICRQLYFRVSATASPEAENKKYPGYLSRELSTIFFMFETCASTVSFGPVILINMDPFFPEIIAARRA